VDNSEKAFALEIPGKQQAQNHSNSHDVIDGVVVGVEGEVNIHAIETGDERRHHENDGNDGQEAHGVVQVVGNDRAISFHRAIENVGVRVGHFERLPIVDDDIFE